MSLLIIAVDNRRNIKNPTIYVVTDKRVGKSENYQAGLKDWQFVHDDSVKFSKISKNIILCGGSNVSHGMIFEARLNHLISIEGFRTGTDVQPSKIIEFAESIDRGAFNTHGLDIPLHDPIICGIWDDGVPFIWETNRDGTNKLEFFNEGKFRAVVTGGKDGTIQRLNTFIRYSLAKMAVEQVLTSAVEEAASFDDWISPTYDLDKIAIPLSYSHQLANKILNH